MKIGSRLSPGAERRKADERIQEIDEFWSQLYACGDPGATTWDVLDRLQRDVMEAMVQQPPDLQRMDAATAKAFLHITGNNTV